MEWRESMLSGDGTASIWSVFQQYVVPLIPFKRNNSPEELQFVAPIFWLCIIKE